MGCESSCEVPTTLESEHLTETYTRTMKSQEIAQGEKRELSGRME